MDDFVKIVHSIFGVNADSLTFGHMAARAAFLYLAALFIIRIGDKRFIGKNTTFDVILGIIIGSVTSRAINGTAGMFATIGALIVLVGFHWIIAYFSFYNPKVAVFAKGKRHKIIENGRIKKEQIKKIHLSEEDLKEQLRVKLGDYDIANIKEAVYERNGEISFVIKREPEVFEFPIEEGVKKVQILINK